MIEEGHAIEILRQQSNVEIIDCLDKAEMESKIKSKADWARMRLQPIVGGTNQKKQLETNQNRKVIIEAQP